MAFIVFNNKWRRARLLPLWGAAALSSVALGQSLPLISFSIKPHLCVLAEEETACEDELEIQWRAEEPLDVCLFSSQVAEPLRCWQGATSGRYLTSVATASDIDFELRAEGADDSLASRAFEVVQDDASYRKRRRNPWSFF